MNFTDPREAIMVQVLNEYPKLTGTDLLRLMGVRYYETVSGHHQALISLRCVRAKVNQIARNYGIQVTGGYGLHDDYWLETIN